MTEQANPASGDPPAGLETTATTPRAPSESAAPAPRGPEAPTARSPEAAAAPARWRPPVAVAVVVVGLIAGQIAAAGVMIAAGGRDASNEATALGLLLADAIVLGVILTFAARGAERLTAATLGVRRTRFWQAVGWAVVIWVGITALEGLWALLVGDFSNVEEGPPPSTVAILLLLLGVAVMAPIVEELAFRGYLFPALTRWRGPWIAAALTAVLFGAAHISSSPVEALPALAVFGFGACLLYWFTGSLLPCVGLHAANNALVAGGAGEWTWQIPLALFACVLVSILLLLPFARENAPHAAEPAV
jgi:membrane protease YdiL (CAAX protease family)